MARKGGRTGGGKAGGGGSATVTPRVVDDFGVIVRGDDDVAVCASGAAFQHAEKCKVIDDAIVYLQSSTSAQVVDLMDKASMGSPYLPNTPPGRLPDFYRAIVIARLFNQKTLKPPTLKQVLAVMDLVEDTRNRDDDFAMMETATRAVLGYKLTPAEQAWVDERLIAVQNAGGLPVNPPPKDEKPPILPPASSASAGAGIALVAGLALVGLVLLARKSK